MIGIKAVEECYALREAGGEGISFLVTRPLAEYKEDRDRHREFLIAHQIPTGVRYRNRIRCLCCGCETTDLVNVGLMVCARCDHAHAVVVYYEDHEVTDD